MVDKYYSVEQIAEMIDLHPKTIQRYLREGRLKAQKIGKSWRVAGHDLSVFVEGAESRGMGDAVPGLQTILSSAAKSTKVSSIIDIPVQNSSEAVQVANWISAAMNANLAEYGYSSMNSQYIEPEHIIRIMLWGSLSFMAVIMSSLAELGIEE